MFDGFPIHMPNESWFQSSPEFLFGGTEMFIPEEELLSASAYASV